MNLTCGAICFEKSKELNVKPNLIVSHTICDTMQPLGGVSKICKYVPLDGVWFYVATVLKGFFYRRHPSYVVTRQNDLSCK